MKKSANEVMHDIIFSAIISSFETMRKTSNGMPNVMLRDINSIHSNSTVGDLPDELRKTISESVESGMKQMMKEGYHMEPGMGKSRFPPIRKTIAKTPTTAK